MLRIAERALDASALSTLSQLQAQIDRTPDYISKVDAAKSSWKGRTSTKAGADAFRVVRRTLVEMCVGSARCTYCEDSLADEIEHIKPKSFFPDMTFVWENYLFACGPCNSPKGNRYGFVDGQIVREISRRRDDPIVPPAPGLSALIDPRHEDPMDFLELDVGGTTFEGSEIVGTFEFIPIDTIDQVAASPAQFSIDVLGLNREVIRAARENAFTGFRARLREYVEEREAGVTVKRLSELRRDLLNAPHLTVFVEMLRQRSSLPEIDILIQTAPEVQTWPMIPDAD